MTSIHVRRLAGNVARTKDRIIDFMRTRNGDAVLRADDILSMRLPWFETRADTDGRAVGVEGDATIFIFDEIGGSFGVDADSLVREIEAITAPHIKVRINSPGGSVFDALAIHSALLHHPARVTTYVDAMAASAASIIAMAGDEVVMMPGSQFMIHDASAIEGGNAADHGKMQKFLDRQSDNLAGIYAGRAGGDVEGWRLLMIEETWAFAEESVALGLADRVEDPYHRDVPEDVEARQQKRHDLSRFAYRYDGRAQAPAPQSLDTALRQHRAKTRVEVRDRPEAPQREATRTPDRAQAALARRSAAERAGGGSVHLQRREAATMALGTSERRLPFTAALTASMTERDGKSFHVVDGYASVFNTPYAMWDEFGPYDEVVMSGAADETLRAKPHVVFLANHGGLALANTKNGTLELSADSNGLRDVAYLNPERQDVNDLVTAIRDETITEQSFAFYITEGVWTQDFTEFRILRFDINRGDVSAVNYGANPHTSIAARQREIFTELRKMSPAQQRAAAAILGGMDNTSVPPEVVSKMIRDEVDARMTKPETRGTSLTHRWATLMADLDM